MYHNKNIALHRLEEMVTLAINNKVNYLPNSFQEKQFEALQIFKQRFFLEKVIEESINFNKKLLWNYDNQNLKLTTTAEELIEVFKLRSDVYDSINYLDEFPDTIDGLNFDTFDKNSAILYYKNDNKVTGSIRLIFDSKSGLPSEEKLNFDSFRHKYSTIGEISRNVVFNEGRGLNLEFKYLMCGIYNIFTNNNINVALSGIKQEHLKLFKKLGGVDVVKEMDSYGSLNVPFYIISYNPLEASPFFKKVFLEDNH